MCDLHNLHACIYSFLFADKHIHIYMYTHENICAYVCHASICIDLSSKSVGPRALKFTYAHTHTHAYNNNCVYVYITHTFGNHSCDNGILGQFKWHQIVKEHENVNI